ncbi:PadR family transcriptional regulator [Naasia lichenicola]|uniref:PadR family transcriptional regulator n=1 Tax=Naasia lichenicola TaxID=2565933 RepID=A0A4S4FKX4_9MICO|nr:PadR family transcriptional regulator [Naasia lichenicola]THG30999.1 PadR family transcriptional regulator [Naasia lichenicola]
MIRSNAGGTSGARSGAGGGRSRTGIWDAMDQLRDTFEQRFEERSGSRMGRGDVRTAVLAILTEEPMHGYQIIRAIEERSNGMWKPSPGSVYPTLQVLADEGLVTAVESAGKKTYSLTDAGRVAAETAPDVSAPWEAPGKRAAALSGAIPKAGAQLAQAAAQVAHAGSPEDVAEAVAVLDEARRKLYAILARS